MAMSSRRPFGQRPPPVSRLIKTILDRYPDGQIFKVNFLLSLIHYLKITFITVGIDSKC